MELRQLQYFLVVADELHFGRAAELLSMSQPPLTVAVKKLEKELNVLLFDRSTRSVKLTAAGQMFRDGLTPVLADLGRVVSEVSEVNTGIRGKLTIGFVSSASYTVIPEAVRLFRERRPLVELALNPVTTDEQVDLLVEGRLDIGILRDPMRLPGMNLEQIHTEPLVLVLPEAHPLAALTKVSVDDFAREKFILFPYKHMSGFFSVVHSLFDGHGQPKIVEQAIHQETILGLVAAGLGMSILPASVARFQMPGVAFRPIISNPQSILYMARGSANPAAEAFMECLREVQ
ncbi:LysR family transcriptional regulator [Paeniglutamicibacter terrestris]|uniref:LysR family transcriptional regulator n=1 Tax=Paeniglutamicibacter terrestris TaxID=2723403 RepID=A0ABX1G2W8_9MICC|nr:LysR family transcriptional regulator [Paeniglutamicibacter terrestris]NKG19910.1 LysR family transcriptional regulator [Paeniglutamicibacter terrestris]